MGLNDSGCCCGVAEVGLRVLELKGNRFGDTGTLLLLKALRDCDEALGVDASAVKMRLRRAAWAARSRRGDARPASARVADHIDRLGGLVDALWNPQLERLRAKIAAATVVDRRKS